MFHTTTAPEARTLMPQYDLDRYHSVKLVISPETSERIADLRAHYKRDGRNHNSLAKVVEDAVLLLHSQTFSVQPRPSDSDDFFFTDAKD